MTKAEQKKCEQMLNYAIELARMAQYEFNDSDVLREGGDPTDFEIATARANRDYGMATGIHSVLNGLCFEHENMRELEDLL